MALTPDEIHSLRDACEEIAQPVIEWLLKDIADGHRQCKAQDQPKRAAMGHIPDQTNTHLSL